MAIPPRSFPFSGRKRPSRGPRAGMAYVAVLILTLLMTTLGLAFLYRAATEASVTTQRMQNMQAQYLAEAAVNHALWRLINDSALPDQPDVYHMHTFGAGRYGYRIRKNTSTTFAAVATVGIVGANVIRQSYVICLNAPPPDEVIPRSILTAYDTNLDAADTIPKYRVFSDPDWSTEGATVDVAQSSVEWVDLQASPVAQQAVMGTLDSADRINLALWNGIAWGNAMLFCTDADHQNRCFDAAYESFSGNALALGRSGSGSTAKYTVLKDSSWLYYPPIDGPTPGAADIQVVVTASDPSSNDILAAFLAGNRDIYLFRWDGASFTDLGRLGTASPAANRQPMDIAFEQRARLALIAWAPSSLRTFSYRPWDGSTLGPEQQGPDFGDKLHLIRLAADPNSNQILLAAATAPGSLYAALWDGATWLDSREIETSLQTTSELSFALAWEPTGNEAIIAWGKSGFTDLRYFRWTKGTPLSSGNVFIGPSCPYTFQTFEMTPVGDSEKIILECNNGLAESNLYYTLWNGDAFQHDPPTLLSTNIASLGKGSYALVENAPGASPWAQARVAYDTNTDALDVLPKSRPYSGGKLGGESFTVDVRNQRVHWLHLATCPIRNEMVMAALDDLNDVNLAVWSPDGWGYQREIETESESGFDCLSVAYEKLSGKALALSRTKPESAVKYTIWNGSAWSPSPAATAFDTGGGKIKLIVTAQHPFQNEILIAVVDDAKRLFLYRWNGSAFSSLGTIETGVTAFEYHVADIAYEQQTGRAILAWGKDGSTTPRYRAWDGSTLSAEGSLPDFGKKARFIRLVADRKSNQILAAALDDDKDLNVALWNGTAWSDSREVENDVLNNDRQDYDLAWTWDGNKVLLGWTRNGTSALEYFSWTTGTPLSSGVIAGGPDFVKPGSTMRFFPLYGASEVLLLVCNGDRNLLYSVWDGSVFKVDPPVAVAGSIADDKNVPYSITGR